MIWNVMHIAHHWNLFVIAWCPVISTRWYLSHHIYRIRIVPEFFVMPVRPDLFLQ